MQRLNIKDTSWEFIIWMGSFIVLGFVVLFAMYSYKSVEKEMAIQFNREQGLLAQQTAMGIEQYMGDITNILSLTAKIQPVTAGDPAAIDIAVRDAYAAIKNKVAFVFWEDSGGIMRYHYPERVLPELDGKDFSFRTYFRVAREMGVPFVSDIIKVGCRHCEDIPGCFETFLIAFPLRSDDGHFNGVIGCAIDLANITAHYVAPMQPSNNGYAWLLDETGMILYHPDPKIIGRNLYDLIIELQRQGLKISGTDDIRHGMELKNDGMYEFVFPHYPNNMPTKKLLAFSSVHFLNRRWVTVVTSPYSEVIHLMSGTFQNTLTLGSVSIAFVLIATLILLRMNRARVVAHERNKWADKMLVAHKRLETIFNGVPHYLIMIDAAFIIMDVNQRYCDLYGTTREDLIGKHCEVDLAPADRLCHSDIVARCFQTGDIITDHDRRVVIGQKPFFFDISAIPLLGARGEVDSVVQYAVDLSEKKALTEKLLQADKLAAIGQISAHVAHEIRNPLASVLLNAELLEDELHEAPGNPEACELVDIIKGEIDRLAQITDEYLSYARLPHPRIQSIDPADEVRATLGMLQPELDRRGTAVALTCRDIPAAIAIDRGQFRQVLINLVKNASDAMPSGGKIEISMLGINDNFLLLVKDMGFGIPHDIKRRIFDPYFTTKENGTGLGLSLVQYIANAHDGWVDVESQRNSGSTFIFSIPCQRHAIEVAEETG